MAFCEHCKTQGQTTKRCSFCGKVICTEKAQFIYGPTEKQAVPVEVTLTSRYLLVRDRSKGAPYKSAIAQEMLGLLPPAEAQAIKGSKQIPYGYYDLQELSHVIYPLRTKEIIRLVALRFVNKDGSCFVLRFKRKKVAKKFAKRLRKLRVSLLDKSEFVYNVCSPAPFVRKDNFGLRVCHSAAPFVKKLPGQFVAQPIRTTSEALCSDKQKEPLVPTTHVVPGKAVASAVPAETSVMPKESPVAPVAPVAQPAPVAPVAPVVQSAPAAPVAAPPVKRFCPSCGTPLPEGSRFCPACGTAI